jgi:hypothetical protein
MASGDFEESRFLYDHLTSRLYYFERGWWTRLQVVAGRLPLVFPRTFNVLNRSTAKLTGRRILEHRPSGRMD